MIYRLFLSLLLSVAFQVSANSAFAQEAATAEVEAKADSAKESAAEEVVSDASQEAADTSSEEAEEEDAAEPEKAKADDDDDHDDADHDSEGHDSEAHDEDDHAHDGEHHEGDHAEHGAHGGGGESTPNPLATDPDLAIWTLGIFLLMLFILKSMAWTPIMEGLKAREEGITGNLAAADAKHEEAKALLSEHQSKLAGTADEVRELLEEARRDAEQTKTDILAEAKSAADKERERAVRDIEQARDSAVRQLAESSAGMAIDLAAKVVQKDISSDRQGEIVKEALGRFASSNPSSN